MPLVVANSPTNTSSWSTGRDVMVAFVMAIGLSTVFLTPYKLSRVTADAAPAEKSAGRILGEATTRPLKISVIIHLGNQRWESVTSPIQGTVAEAVSQAAGAAHQSFTYISRGHAMYLQSFANQPNDLTGSWIVSVNGLSQIDLSSHSLEQGDEVELTWTPS